MTAPMGQPGALLGENSRGAIGYEPLLQYDFVRAAREGSGFVTTHLSNSISSDYLRGLTVQVAHELFDRSQLNPTDSIQRGSLGKFAPRLSSLSTGFDLGPTSALFRWLGLANERNAVTQDVAQAGSVM